MTTANILRVAMFGTSHAEHDRLLLNAQRERARVKRASARREAKRLAQAREVGPVTSGFEALHKRAA